MYTQFDKIKSKISDDDIKRYKQIVLQILVDFDLFLKQHQIKYSLAFGTMIGAVRHKGFIPWDDDIDIILSQEQYQKLLTVIEEFNSEDYKVVLPCSDDCTSFARAIKIYYTKATIKEFGVECYTGPFIDVFTTIDVKHKRSLSYYRFLCTAYDIKNGHVNLKNANTKSAKIIAFLAKFITKRSLKKKILKYYNKKTNSEYCVNSSGSLYQYKKTYFEEFIEVDFEGYKFPISAYYDQMLKTVYGDYMQLPPEDCRNPHHFEELIFDSNFEDKNN